MTAYPYPTHHPDDELLLAYASGALDTPWELVIGVHLALCPHCRAAAASFEEAGGQALESAEPLAMAADPAALIARAEAAGPRPKAANAPADAVFPQPLRGLAGDLADVTWSSLAPGMKQKVLMRRGAVSVRLLHFAPGAAAAEHGHRGPEMTTVLTGGYHDGEAAYSRGDIQIVGEGTLHRPVGMIEEPCVCLAVTSGPLRFTGPLARLVQVFARI